MSLLTIIQDVAVDMGITAPSTVIGNGNTQVAQLLQLAQREGQDLARRYPWKALTAQASFTYTTGQKDQGVLNGTVVSTGDYNYILNETFWNRTSNQPISGPISAQEIEQIEALPISGPYEKWYTLGKKLYIDPAPTTEDTAAFEYVSTSWCESSGGTGQSTWQADSDVGRLDEDLMELGIVWRWLRRKGMDYTEEFNTYEKRVLDAITREGGKRTVNMGGGMKFNRYVNITPAP